MEANRRRSPRKANGADQRTGPTLRQTKIDESVGVRKRKRAPDPEESDRVKKKPKKEVKAEPAEESTEEIETARAEAARGPPRKAAAKRVKLEKHVKSEDPAPRATPRGAAISDDSPMRINRAPVLTLWTAVVAHAEGHSWDTAVTLGKYVAGMFAQAKGRSLGLFEESTTTKEEREEARGKHYAIKVLGRKLYVRDTPDGTRAIPGGKEIDPAPVHRYLEQKFGEDLPRIKAAMEAVAASYGPDTDSLDKDAYDIYVAFRPEIPAGKGGWGRQGELRPSTILAHARAAVGRPAA